MNATTGQPVPNQFVNLLALREQMVPVRETETDGQGRYRFVVDANPSERFLVQVPFRGVNYNRPALFATGDRITADVEVFDSGARAEDIHLEGHVIFLEPHRGHLRINEVYSLANRSQPPRTFAPEEGSFRFALRGPVGDLQVSARRAAGMTLRQQPQPTEGKDTYVISFPFYPGESEVQVSYALPLSGDSATVRLPLLLASARRHVVVPSGGVELEGKGLKPIEHAPMPEARIYQVELEAPTELALTLKVDPAALEAAEATPEPAAPAAASESSVILLPHPTNQAQWYIVGVGLFVLSVGLLYLYSLRPPERTSDAAGRPTDRPVG